MKFTSYLAAILLLLSFGCGRDKNDCVSAPSGASITISPPSMTVNDPYYPSRVFSQPFTIAVKDADGNPANKIRINIFFPWAYPQLSAVQLYDGSTPVNSPFDACTDGYGVYNLRVDYQSGGGLDYHGDIEVRSGDAFTPATLTVTKGTTT